MSKILTIKALVYKYTGWFLAQKEQDAYIFSQEHKDYVQHILKNQLNVESEGDDWPIEEEEATDISIGMWQCHHGFARPATFLAYNNPRWFWRIAAWWIDLYTVIKWDIETLWRKYKS